MVTTVSPDEIEKFSRIADEWWDPAGKFAPLHKINPVRVEYITERLRALGFRLQEKNTEAQSLKPEASLRLLDIGCGGGLISEPMARLGARVTGIDASERNIEVARLHAERSGLNIDYRCTTAEELAGLQASGSRLQEKNTEARRPTPEAYDVVLALEIIEHVADVGLFVQSVMKLVKPGGLVIFSTINRTPKAFALAVVGAEYVLRWLPRGTHDWHKFVRPSELLAYAEQSGGTLEHMTGMVMNPLTFQWSLKEHDVSVNYLITLKRSGG